MSSDNRYLRSCTSNLHQEQRPRAHTGFKKTSSCCCGPSSCGTSVPSSDRFNHRGYTTNGRVSYVKPLLSQQPICFAKKPSSEIVWTKRPCIRDSERLAQSLHDGFPGIPTSSTTRHLTKDDSSELYKHYKHNVVPPDRCSLRRSPRERWRNRVRSYSPSCHPHRTYLDSRPSRHTNVYMSGLAPYPCRTHTPLTDDVVQMQQLSCGSQIQRDGPELRLSFPRRSTASPDSYRRPSRTREPRRVKDREKGRNSGPPLLRELVPLCKTNSSKWGSLQGGGLERPLRTTSEALPKSPGSCKRCTPLLPLAGPRGDSFFPRRSSSPSLPREENNQLHNSRYWEPRLNYPRPRYLFPREQLCIAQEHTDASSVKQEAAFASFGTKTSVAMLPPSSVNGDDVTPLTQTRLDSSGSSTSRTDSEKSLQCTASDYSITLQYAEPVGPRSPLPNQSLNWTPTGVTNDSLTDPLCASPVLPRETKSGGSQESSLAHFKKQRSDLSTQCSPSLPSDNRSVDVALKVHVEATHQMATEGTTRVSKSISKGNPLPPQKDASFSPPVSTVDNVVEDGPSQLTVAFTPVVVTPAREENAPSEISQLSTATDGVVLSVGSPGDSKEPSTSDRLIFESSSEDTSHLPSFSQRENTHQSPNSVTLFGSQLPLGDAIRASILYAPKRTCPRGRRCTRLVESAFDEENNDTGRNRYPRSAYFKRKIFTETFFETSSTPDAYDKDDETHSQPAEFAPNSPTRQRPSSYESCISPAVLADNVTIPRKKSLMSSCSSPQTTAVVTPKNGHYSKATPFSVVAPSPTWSASDDTVRTMYSLEDTSVRSHKERTMSYSRCDSTSSSASTAIPTAAHLVEHAFPLATLDKSSEKNKSTKNATRTNKKNDREHRSQGKNRRSREISNPFSSLDSAPSLSLPPRKIRAAENKNTFPRELCYLYQHLIDAKTPHVLADSCTPPRRRSLRQQTPATKRKTQGHIVSATTKKTQHPKEPRRGNQTTRNRKSHAVQSIEHVVSFKIDAALIKTTLPESSLSSGVERVEEPSVTEGSSSAICPTSRDTIFTTNIPDATMNGATGSTTLDTLCHPVCEEPTGDVQTSFSNVDHESASLIYPRPCPEATMEPFPCLDNANARSTAIPVLATSNKSSSSSNSTTVLPGQCTVATSSTPSLDEGAIAHVSCGSLSTFNGENPAPHDVMTRVKHRILALHFLPLASLVIPNKAL